MKTSQKSVLPASNKDITSEWLSGVLGANIQIISLIAIGDDAGFMSDVFRITLQSEEDSAEKHLPATLIIKIAAADEKRQAAATAYRSYQKEVQFYQNIASQVGVRVPYCYFHACNVAGDRFALVLEDLGQWKTVDRMSGANFKQTMLAMTTLGKLHARYWGGTIRDIPGFTEGYQVAAEELSIMIPAVLKDVATYANSVAFLLHYSQNILSLLPRLQQQQQTLNHMDFRLDNLRFTDDDTEIILFDWGEFAMAPPGYDLAHFLTTNIEIENRRQWEEAAVALYHQTLVREGVLGISLAEIKDSYQQCIAPSFYVPCLVWEMSRGGRPATIEYADRLIARSLASIEDHLAWL